MDFGLNTALQFLSAWAMRSVTVAIPLTGLLLLAIFLGARRQGAPPKPLKRKRRELLRPQMPSGLINVGNSCYLSSVLQLLASAGELVINHFRACNLPIASALSELLEAINRGEERRLAPISFIKSFAGASMGEGLSPEQQDAHEFLLALLNMKSKDRKQRRRNPADSITLDTAEIDKSILSVSDPFTGVLLRELICLPCASKRKLRHTSSLRIEPFSCVTLTPPSSSSLKISEALYKHFCAPERFSDYCNYNANGDSCGFGAVNQKRPLIFPRLLFLHVSLLLQAGDSHLKSQQVIETEAELSGPGYRYKLVSIIVHYGQGGLAGHFVCYRRILGKTWIECNDEDIKTVSEELVMAQRAYILLYERED